MTETATDNNRETGRGFPCGIRPGVELVGRDGNAFAILGRCQGAAQDADVPQKEIEDFIEEAMSGDYNHLLQMVITHFDTQMAK